MNSQIQNSAQTVLSCKHLDETIHFFKQKLAFRLDSIFPADEPATAIISGHGLTLRLEKDSNTSNAVIRIERSDVEKVETVTAPNGTQIQLVSVADELTLPPSKPSFVLTRLDQNANWISGRAGMRYRDLIPNRQNGRFIASHIVIPNGGPIPDYVHYHKVRFQMIYCYKGWVKVVYEDQGGPFVMQAGDCVLQPPQIRHRVLESSENCEVIEIACPAEHETLIDHELNLPTSNPNTKRDFNGQRFVHHTAKDIEWLPWRAQGFEYRDIGIDAATDGLASVCVVKPNTMNSTGMQNSVFEFQMYYLLRGSCLLTTQSHGDHELNTGDCIAMPGVHTFKGCTDDLELLEITLPAFVQ